MLNILKSDFYKLKKSRAFWICTALCVIFGAMMVFYMQKQLAAAQLSGHDHDLDPLVPLIPHVSGIFMMGNLMSVLGNTPHILIMGVFTAIFVSSEFIYGTMKNTLSRGADRIKVIFSKFIVCSIASLVMLGVYTLATLITGTMVWGFDPQKAATFLGILAMLLTQALLVLSFTTIFVFTSMSMRSNGGAIAVNVICVVLVSLLLSATSSLLGPTVDLGKYWLMGNITTLATISPASGDITHGILVALGWSVAAILAGIGLFKKQDVK
ncbi:ABC transporter permease subunit [Sporolactobacillus pectinivorans]|uniref:ABC transporter permease subunit n=1 Tax=Sporolactobacillus pectinivorans TaxID=1591408 RepID=UPI000C25EB89|nr:ABC transporter permease subunit [Sporolactobacillus pectinivorans]